MRSRKGRNGFFGLFMSVLLLISLNAFMAPRSAQAQYRTVVSVEKRCGNCGRVVSSSAKVGDRCPYCGVIWGRESTSTKTTYGLNVGQSSYYDSYGKSMLWLAFSLSSMPAGINKVHFPQCFGNQASDSYGIEFGGTGDNHQKWLILFRYRYYYSPGDYYLDDWNQYYLECGFRSLAIPSIGHILQPLFGMGIGYSKVHYDRTYSGLGAYCESGLELRIAKPLSVVGMAEYSVYRLGYQNEWDEFQKFGNHETWSLKLMIVLTMSRQN